MKWLILALSEHSRFGASSVCQRRDTVNPVWNRSWRHKKRKKLNILRKLFENSFTWMNALVVLHAFEVLDYWLSNRNSTTWPTFPIKQFSLKLEPGVLGSLTVHTLLKGKNMFGKQGMKCNSSNKPQEVPTRSQVPWDRKRPGSSPGKRFAVSISCCAVHNESHSFYTHLHPGSPSGDSFTAAIQGEML